MSALAVEKTLELQGNQLQEEWMDALEESGDVLEVESAEQEVAASHLSRLEQEQSQGSRRSSVDHQCHYLPPDPLGVHVSVKRRN